MRNLIRVRRTLRGIMPLALALSLLWPAAVARAAVSCSFDGAAGIVSVSFAHGDVPTISRLGDAIAVDGVACGTATVTNTDSIDVAFADDPDSDLVVIDLSGGPLAPGATDEGDGSSEIEIDVTGGDGSWDTLRIVGTSGPDAFDASFLAVNMNAGETVTDSDVTLDDTISIELIAVDGDDTLSVDPFSAYGGVTMLGGDGDDRISGRLGGSDDVLDAGPGRDVAEYLWEPNELDLVWDESGDAHFLSGYGDVIANVEVAVLTDGGDSVTYEGDAIGETWLGDSFDTVNVIDPSPLVSPDDRIIHGGPGAFDSIRFDLPTPFFAYVELSLDTLGGIWPATYDDFEYIFGSSGDDWFLVDHPGVYPMLVGELGDDTIDLRNAVQGMDVTLGQDIFGDGDWLHTREFERIFGTPFGDVFLGPRAGVVGAVTFHGYAGKDFLRGGDRADVLRGGGGADTLSGGDGADTLFGSAGGDVLRGGFGPDELRGGPGDDVLRGGQGEDACVGGRGRDLVDCER